MVAKTNKEKQRRSTQPGGLDVTQAEAARAVGVHAPH
jgi:hypothetical protein